MASLRYLVLPNGGEESSFVLTVEHGHDAHGEPVRTPRQADLAVVALLLLDGLGTLFGLACTTATLGRDAILRWACFSLGLCPKHNGESAPLLLFCCIYESSAGEYVLGCVPVHDEELGKTVHALERLPEEEGIYATAIKPRNSYREPSVFINQVSCSSLLVRTIDKDSPLSIFLETRLVGKRATGEVHQIVALVDSPTCSRKSPNALTIW